MSHLLRRDFLAFASAAALSGCGGAAATLQPLGSIGRANSSLAKTKPGLVVRNPYLNGFVRINKNGTTKFGSRKRSSKFFIGKSGALVEANGNTPVRLYPLGSGPRAGSWSQGKGSASPASLLIDTKNSRVLITDSSTFTMALAPGLDGSWGLGLKLHAQPTQPTYRTRVDATEAQAVTQQLTEHFAQSQAAAKSHASVDAHVKAMADLVRDASTASSKRTTKDIVITTCYSAYVVDSNGNPISPINQSCNEYIITTVNLPPPAGGGGGNPCPPTSDPFQSCLFNVLAAEFAAYGAYTVLQGVVAEIATLPAVALTVAGILSLLATVFLVAFAVATLILLAVAIYEAVQACKPCQ
jgi:hypothetical protein